jgi:parallel beta-helix repeat protein
MAKKNLYRIGLLLLASIYIILCGTAAATTYYVSDGQSIQSAIGNASDDDTIIVNSGLYKENVIVNKKLILRGNDTGSGLPVVDAMQNGNDVILLNTNGVILQGFNATNASDEAGIHVKSNNNIIQDNIANFNYWGISVCCSKNNNTVYNNTMYQNVENANDDGSSTKWNSTSFGNYYDDIVMVDNNNDGINDNFYSIGGGAGTKDYFPLVVSTKAESPLTVSSSNATKIFTVNTTLTDFALVGISNISLYYNLSNATGVYTFYANSSTGTFTFTADSDGDYYFYTVATDSHGIVENVPSAYDCYTNVSTTSTSTTYYVSDGESIQSAIDNASTDDTIIVNSGLYKENINITKKLILRGNDTGSGLPVVDAMQNGDAIYLNADGIILEGFIAINATNATPYSGIRVTSNNTIIRNNIAYSNRLGIKVGPVVNNTLYNNTMYQNIINARCNSTMSS